MMETATAEDGYAVRAYRSADRASVVSLRERVFGGDCEEAEFVWKSEESPHASDGRVTVAERRGEVVGAAMIVPLRFRVDGRTIRAAQVVDSLVHPEHRREGLFVRMVMDLYGYSADRADLHFTFPMPTVAGILRNTDSVVDGLGDSGVDLRMTPFPEYYRVQRPSSLRPRGPTTVVRALEAAATPLAAAAREISSRASGSNVEAVVRRHDDVPAADLAELYRRTRPAAPHVERSDDLYRWRFSNPKWDYTTYTASVGGETEAAIVAGTLTLRDGLVMTRLTEVLPLDPSDADESVVAGLLSRVLADHRSSAVVVAGGSCLPPSTLRTFRFLPGDSRLLSTALDSRLFYQSHLAHLPLLMEDGEERSLDDWALTFFAREIG